MEDQSPPVDPESSLALELGRALLDAYRAPAIAARIEPEPPHDRPGEPAKRTMAAEVDRIDRALSEGHERIIRLFDVWGSGADPRSFHPAFTVPEAKPSPVPLPEVTEAVTVLVPEVVKADPPAPEAERALDAAPESMNEHGDPDAAQPFESTIQAKTEPGQSGEKPAPDGSDELASDVSDGRPVWLVNAVAALITALVVTLALLVVNSI